MHPPDIVSVGSNSLWLDLILIVLLVIFHILFVFKLRLDEIQWKYADYIWLIIAALGVIGQAAQVRQHWYATIYEISSYNAKATLRALKQQVNAAIGPGICELPDTPLRQVRAEYKLACAEFTKISKEVLSANEDRDIGFLSLLDTSELRSNFHEAGLLETLDKVNKAYSNFSKAIREQSVAKEKSKSTAGEFTLIIISPFLLIFALAIRITKVSGEILIKRKQKKLLARQPHPHKLPPRRRRKEIPVADARMSFRRRK
jgi:hypothetical protein